MTTRRPEVALIYDFDGTLAPGNMQEHSFIPDLGVSAKKFWADAKALAHKHQGDDILMYMQLMIDEANRADVPIRRKDIQRYGKDIELFKGVADWFDRVNDFAKKRGLNARHYIISSGNAEMIKGTPIAKHFNRVYASTFRYDQNSVAKEPALAINYTAKTQYLFRINKHAFDVNDHEALNEWTEREERPVPFERMIFIGDGASDVPCMRLVKQQGGFSVAVYRPGSKIAKQQAEQLIANHRVDFVAPANYSAGKILDTAVKRRIDLLAAQLQFGRAIGG